jgi:methylthioribose-1-phosphate isomerase
LAADRFTERMVFPTVDYRAGKVRIIDQTLLPAEEHMLELDDYREVADAIRKLKVRGAPAIGIAAAYGVLVALENILRRSSPESRGYFFDREEGVSEPPVIAVPAREIRDELHRAREVLASTRPTAVNLFWALERIGAVVDGAGNDAVELTRRIAEEVFAIHREELEVEFTIGKNGSVFVEDGMGILTHCNAGGLATAGYGTALGVLYRAYEEGKRFTVYADETRPLLQGARITTWELQRRGIETVLLCDNAAASLFAAGKIDAAIVGADRIAANGDTANKVGTLGVALLCERFGKPFYVAAPWSSFDTNLSSGVEIPIEERDGSEVTAFWGRETAPRGTFVYNPAFDITPAGLITAVITERGVIECPDTDAIERIAREFG